MPLLLRSRPRPPSLASNLRFLSTLSGEPLAAALEAAKTAAGLAAVESIRKEQTIIGIGSGSTVVSVVEALRTDRAMHVDRWFVPSGYQSRELILSAGLRLGDIEQFPLIDVTFDGADDIDSNLNAIKGGGGCHLREKVLAEKSQEFVLVADWRKESSVLGGGEWKKGIPIEIVPFANSLVQEAIQHVPGYESMTLRMGGTAKAGPAVTDNGNLIIDAIFSEGEFPSPPSLSSPASSNTSLPLTPLSLPHPKIEMMSNPRNLLLRLKILTGVVEVGLFTNIAQEVFYGLEDGTVKRVTR